MVRAILWAVCLIGLCASNPASTQTDNFEACLDGLVAAQFNRHDLAGMTFVFVFFIAILQYWNLIGWNY